MTSSQEVTPADSVLSVLSSIDNWPVPRVAGAVRDGSGEWITHGDIRDRYGLASVTKLLSAHAMLVAYEEGVFDLDTDLSPRGPEGATVRHYLSHASGVGFASPKPEKPVGERRLYSSAGFDVVADAIAAETEMSFSEYLRLATFEPLGMESSALHGSAGHAGEGNVVDLMNFVDEILEPTLLDPATVDEALTVQFPGLNGVVPGYGLQKPADWGLGFQIYSQPESRGGLWFGADMPGDTVGHFGQAGTFVWLHKATGRAAIVLTERPFGDWAKPLWTEFNDALWQALDS
ncbi:MULTISPECIES: serine hydrolase domain-containing protein [unclassified Corynebacterium]|uniref:serine hydrolase domain-containing protein n=1 Tax=unclassified Corynebacterium TaxID=2624378 RepID=UPI00309E2F2B